MVPKRYNCVAIFPIKTRSTRVVSKNFMPFNGAPLFEYVLRKHAHLKGTCFDEIFVDSDSEQVQEFCVEHGLKFIERKASLAKDSANGNDLLNYHSEIIESDFYFQLFVTAPLLKSESISQCVERLRSERGHDSIFTVSERFTWYWFDGKPVNYDPTLLPRSQDARPVLQETTGLYGIRRDALIRRKSRIGDTPIFHTVTEVEAADIDNTVDFKVAEFLSRL
jgi:CMP-N-acetylneuraminic acid synthetase